MCYILTAPVNKSFYILNRRQNQQHIITVQLHNSSLLGFTRTLDA